MSGSLLQFAEVCDALAATTKKLEKRAIISNYMHGLSVDDAARAALYIAGTPFSETDRRALKAGGSLLSRALTEVAEANRDAMQAAYRRHGDLGAAAQDLLEARESASPTLTLRQLDDSLAAIAAARGPAAKMPLVLQLLRSATP